MSIDLAVWAAGIATALTVVLFLYSLGLRIANVLNDRSLARFQARWWPVIAKVAMSETLPEEAALRALRRSARIRLLREWCRFRAHVKGDSGRSLERLAQAFELTGVARRLLRRRATSHKLLATQALGFLRDEKSWDALEELLGHRNVTLSVTAATALVCIDAKRGVDLVIPLIAAREDWPRTQVGRMLNLAGPDVVTEPLCLSIRGAAVEPACRLLRFYESASIHALDSLIAELIATRDEPALLAAALKAVRGHLSGDTITRLAQHDAWFVRMQAANLLGRFGRREDYRILEPLLSDAEWWVRYRAAQAIARLPFLGPHALRKLRDRQSDPYARDILAQAMAEVGLA